MKFTTPSDRTYVDQKYCEIHSKYYGHKNYYKECPECVKDGERSPASVKDYENN